MRRSRAPSVLNKAKRICNLVDNKETEFEDHDSKPEDEEYNWGSKDCNGGKKVFTNQHKRFFNIVWRDVSNKKHKTWKGDGIIEVNLNTMKAVLKDETGKYMGCSTKFNVHDLKNDFQMVIGGKEIELQNEINDEIEICDLRKRQICNSEAEDWVPPVKQAEEQKMYKAGYKFKSVLILKQPEQPRNTSTSHYLPTVSSVHSGTKSDFQMKPNLTQLVQKQRTDVNIKWKEFICFIKPSELQQFLFQQVLDYLNCVKNELSIKMISSLDITNVLRQICNHPSFVNQKSTKNELIRHLLPYLPEWSEMGPFDSGKLEYLQYFLNALPKVLDENCIILAKQTNTLNMLQGLINYMDIKCLRLNKDLSEEIKSEILKEFSTDNNFLQVLLINSMEVLKNVSPTLRCQKLIVFEDVSENIKILDSLQKLHEFNVYYFVTAFSIEELLLLNDYTTESYSDHLLQELCNLSSTHDVCYLHTKIGCKCYERNYELTHYNKDIELLNNWQHFINPFDDKFLKISFLENSAENLVTIFYKTY